MCLFFSSLVDAKDIRTFLHYNPAFLDDFIMTNVDEERLERWLVKKTGKQEKRKACLPSADKAIPKGIMGRIVGSYSKIYIKCRCFFLPLYSQRKGAALKMEGTTLKTVKNISENRKKI